MIRLACKEDCAELAKVHIASWKETYKGILPDTFLAGLDVIEREKRWIELLNDENIRVLLHFSEGKLLGFASVCPCRDGDSELTWGEISAIYYLSDAWGKGFASALMEAVLETIESIGYSKTLVWVLRENQRARAFYSKFGFIPDGIEREFVVRSVGYDELRMARS